MTTPDKRSALDLIKQIATEVEDAQPTKQKMISDLKMMNFKIRPLSGDLFSISSNTDSSFILSLWKIGKIEEIVKTAVDELNDEEADVFFDYLEQFEDELEQAAMHAPMVTAHSSKPKVVRLEVFRDSELEEVLLN